MTRVLGFVLHNWPLKVAAVVLASLLYGVLVLARDAQQTPVAIPIDQRGDPDDAVLLSPLGLVTRVRYIAPPDVAVNSESFDAWVDLSGVTPGDGSRMVDVRLEPVDDRIDALEWEPRRIRVNLDEVATRTVPIRVDQGQVPPGLDVRPATVDPDTAEVRGAASAVERVDRAVAAVTIGTAGVDIDRDIQIVPVDVRGVAIPEVDVVPSLVRVRITIIAEGETKSVPITPDIRGDPAPGFEIDTIRVEPNHVTVEGDGDDIAALERVRTAPVVIAGATGTVDTEIPLAPEPGVIPVPDEPVRVVVAMRPVTGSRSITAGLRLVGALPDRTYDLSVDRVIATIAGPQADIDRFQPETFELELSVANLPPGPREIAPTADLPTGLALLSSSPSTVVVTIGQPQGSPAAASPPVAPSP